MFGLTKRGLWAFWAILLVGLGLRLWLIFSSHDRMMTAYDDKMYIDSAIRLLESGIFTFGSHMQTPTVFIPPLFPLYLTGMFAIFGTGTVGMYAAQIGCALFGVAVLVLVVKLASLWGHPRAGLIAAGLAAVYPPLVLHNSLYLTETMFTMWSLLFFVFLVRAIEEESLRGYVVAGLFLGLATLTRPTFALFPVMVGLYLWGRRGYGFKKAFVAGLVLVATLMLVLSPWIVRNYAAFDRFIPLTKASGNPFLTGTYINNDVWAEGHDPEFPDYPKGWKKVPGDQLATDDLLMEMGIAHLQEQFARDPGAMIWWYTYGKFMLYWADPFDWADLLKNWLGGLTWVHRALLLLALAGVVLAVRRKEPYVWLMVLWFVYFTGLHMVYVTTPRYATPLLPYAFLFIGMLFAKRQRRE